MSAELQSEITRLTAELQKISRIWDIAHEFQERHIARMEEENRGQRAEIIELKAQRDCDREAIANYERMVGDHQGRAAAEVERLEMELEKQAATLEEELDRWRVPHTDDEPSWKHATWNRGKERDQARAEAERLTGERDRLDSSVRFLQRCLKADRERLSLAEKLAERVRLRRGSLNAGDARALDAFISSGRGEAKGETCNVPVGICLNETCDCEEDARPCGKLLPCPDHPKPCCERDTNKDGDCDRHPSGWPPAQPSKDPGEDRIGGGLIIEPADRPYETVGDWAMANARKEVAARLTSLEEENKELRMQIEKGYPSVEEVGVEGLQQAIAKLEEGTKQWQALWKLAEDENERLRGEMDERDKLQITVEALYADLNRLSRERDDKREEAVSARGAAQKLIEENAKLRAFRDAAARDIRHRHNHWIDGRECYTCCEPWPCPPIATLDATEGEPAGAPCVLCTLKACPDPTHEGYAR